MTTDADRGGGGHDKNDVIFSIFLASHAAYIPPMFWESEGMETHGDAQFL